MASTNKYHLLLIGLLLLGAPTMAQESNGESQPSSSDETDTEKDNNEAKSDQNKKEDEKLAAMESDAKKRKAKYLKRLGLTSDYSFELGVDLHYDMTTADVKTADQSKVTELKETEMGGGLQFGWIATDHIEPILEAKYTSVTRQIAEFESTETVLDAGIGLLVNLPQAPPYPGVDGLNKFMRARWIPYFGFLIGQTQAINSNGETTKTKYTDTDQTTKLVFGVRYMVYHHISFNTGLRLLYEKTDSNAELSEEKGASRSKMKVEARLLSLSLFI